MVKIHPLLLRPGVSNMDMTLTTDREDFRGLLYVLASGSICLKLQRVLLGAQCWGGLDTHLYEGLGLTAL